MSFSSGGRSTRVLAEEIKAEAAGREEVEPQQKSRLRLDRGVSHTHAFGLCPLTVSLLVLPWFLLSSRAFPWGVVRATSVLYRGGGGWRRRRRARRRRKRRRRKQRRRRRARLHAVGTGVQ